VFRTGQYFNVEALSGDFQALDDTSIIERVKNAPRRLPVQSENHDIYIREIADYVARAAGVEPVLMWNGVAGQAGMPFWRFSGDMSSVVQAWMSERRGELDEPVWPQ